MIIPSKREIRVQIDSRLELIDLVQHVSDGVGRVVGLDRNTMLNVGLAVREAVINAIKHGNHQNRKKQVHILFRLGEGKLVVSVRDEGAGFDFDAVENPLDPRNIFKSNGRGIFFIKSFVDRVSFSKHKLGGTEVLMEKRVQRRRRSRRLMGSAQGQQGRRG